MAGYAQGDPTDTLPDDPAAMHVYHVQDMNFGTFSAGGSGGSITIDNDGVITQTTGSVVPMGSGRMPAIFEIDAPQGSVITVWPYDGDITLTRSGGGGTLTLQLNSDSSPGPTLTTTVAQPARTEVKLGGKLIIGNSGASPPGSYSGTFEVMFIQE